MSLSSTIGQSLFPFFFILRAGLSVAGRRRLRPFAPPAHAVPPGDSDLPAAAVVCRSGETK